MAAAVPYILMAGGALIKNRADQEQANEKRTQMNQALTRTSQTQEKANTMIGDEASKLSPVARAAAMSMQADANVAGAKSDLAAAGATDNGGNAIINTSGDNGAVSKEFLTSKADRALTEGARLTEIAKQLAKVRAPGQLQEQEGQDRADLTGRLGDMWDTTQNMNRANAQTAENTPLPGYAVAGDVMSAAGQVYGGKMGGAGLGTSRMLPKNAKGGTIWGGGDTAMPGGFA
jgi:hypothetical protein